LSHVGVHLLLRWLSAHLEAASGTCHSETPLSVPPPGVRPFFSLVPLGLVLPPLFFPNQSDIHLGSDSHPLCFTRFLAVQLSFIRPFFFLMPARRPQVLVGTHSAALSSYYVGDRRLFPFPVFTWSRDRLGNLLFLLPESIVAFGSPSFCCFWLFLHLLHVSFEAWVQQALRLLFPAPSVVFFSPNIVCFPSFTWSFCRGVFFSHVQLDTTCSFWDAEGPFFPLSYPLCFIFMDSPPHDIPNLHPLFAFLSPPLPALSHSSP